MSDLWLALLLVFAEIFVAASLDRILDFWKPKQEKTQRRVFVFIFLLGSIILTIGIVSAGRKSDTSSLTKTLTPTVTFTISPTETDSPDLIITQKSSVTPEPSATPESCPSFSTLLIRYPEISELLGSPRGSTHRSSLGYAYEEFEHGYMLWRGGDVSGVNTITVMFPRENTQPYGTWNLYQDTWYEPTPGIPHRLTPPGPGLIQPAYGFGIVWYFNNEVKNTLGWATMNEIAINAIVQSYTYGMLLCIDRIYDDVQKPDEIIGKVFAIIEEDSLYKKQGYWILIE